MNWGIEVLQTSALPLGYAAFGNEAENVIQNNDLRQDRAAFKSLNYGTILLRLANQPLHDNTSF